MYTGYVDSSDHHSIIGWAADTDRPDARLELRVMVNGALQGRVIADRPRAPLCGSRAIVTGAGRGIGHAIALRLASAAFPKKPSHSATGASYRPALSGWAVG